ncbi:MAG: hypothetical protein ABWX92_17955 [Mycetocola sp.]
MSAELLPRDSSTSTGDDDDLCHLFCCDENWSACGVDLTGDLVSDDDDEPVCVVCEDLFPLGCANPDCPERAAP